MHVFFSVVLSLVLSLDEQTRTFMNFNDKYNKSTAVITSPTGLNTFDVYVTGMCTRVIILIISLTAHQVHV